MRPAPGHASEFDFTRTVGFSLQPQPLPPSPYSTSALLAAPLDANVPPPTIECLKPTIKKVIVGL